MTIPNSVTSIGTYAFDGCSGLAAVHITDIAKWCCISFGGSSGNPLYYAHKLYLNGSLVEDLTIPDGVTSIGNYAFDGCSGLTSVTIPNSITIIGNYAFDGCSGLTKVTIPETMTSIEEYAFYNCNRLNCVLFEGNAPSVGSYAFQSVSSDACIYVSWPSTGWNVEIPGKWNGVAIDYIRHELSFDCCGGVCDVAALQIEDGKPLGVLPVPSRDNYGFLGWYTEQGEVIDASSTFREPQTVYARWRINSPTFIPESGTAFTGSLTVSIVSPAAGASIHCVIDGSEPTIDSPVCDRLVIEGKTKVRAVAEKDGMVSEVAEAEYALGQCATPLLDIVDTVDNPLHPRCVAIRWENDGVLRYTLDGSDPTESSPVYESPIVFDGSVVLKTKVFSGDFFDSPVVTARFAHVSRNGVSTLVRLVNKPNSVENLVYDGEEKIGVVAISSRTSTTRTTSSAA